MSVQSIHFVVCSGTVLCLSNIWVVFHFLSSMDNAAVIIHATVLMHMYTYFSCVYSNTWNYQVIRLVYFSLLDYPKQFSRVVVIYAPTSHVRIPIAHV